jgi:hypothetical protein
VARCTAAAVSVDQTVHLLIVLVPPALLVVLFLLA